MFSYLFIDRVCCVFHRLIKEYVVYMFLFLRQQSSAARMPKPNLNHSRYHYSNGYEMVEFGDWKAAWEYCLCGLHHSVY